MMREEGEAATLELGVHGIQSRTCQTSWKNEVSVQAMDRMR